MLPFCVGFMKLWSNEESKTLVFYHISNGVNNLEDVDACSELLSGSSRQQTRNNFPPHIMLTHIPIQGCMTGTHSDPRLHDWIGSSGCPCSTLHHRPRESKVFEPFLLLYKYPCSRVSPRHARSNYVVRNF